MGALILKKQSVSMKNNLCCTNRPGVNMKKILFPLLLLFASSAWATDYYYSDCQAGAAAGCIAGDNANLGTSPASPKRTPPSNLSLQPGDRMLFARGGSWTNAGITIGSNQTPTNPAVIEAYTPGWCVQSCTALMPKLKASPGSTIISFSNGGVNAVHKDGLTIRNLELYSDPASPGRAGISVYNDANHVLIENVHVHDLDYGFMCYGYTNQPGATDGSSDYLTIRNSRFERNSRQGLASFGSPGNTCNHLLIENNTMDGNGFGGWGVTHSIQFANVNDVVMRGNTITNNGRLGGNGCVSAGILFAGTSSRVLIENNTIQEAAPAQANCSGISVGPVANDRQVDALTDFVIRGNKVVDVGGNGISQTGCLRCVIENNVIVWSQGSSMTRKGIAVKAGTAGSDPDASGGLATIRNNSVYVTGANRDARGYVVSETGAGHVFVSNAAYFDAASVASATCFDYTSKVASDFAAADYNACYGVNGAMLNNNAAGFDAHSISTDPLLSAVPSAGNAWLIQFKAGSPAINAGHRTQSAAKDITGRVRDMQPDIGAYEFPFAVPGVPTGVAAVAGNGQATVSFSAPMDNGGSPVTGYTVISNPAGPNIVDTEAGSTALSHIVTGLVNGTAYTFTVKASNVAGMSVASAPSGSVTPATVPDAPTQLSAIAGNGQATVNFSAPLNNGGSPITGYTVASSPTGANIVDTNAGGIGLSHVVTGLVNGTAYTFTVKASNAKGASVASPASNSVTPIAPLVKLTVSVGGAGSVASMPAGINCGTVCNASFNAGANVTLTATPAAGNVFAGWGGACVGNVPSCSVPMTAAKSVSASFKAGPSVAIRWQAPTLMGDGSPINGLAGFKVYGSQTRQDLQPTLLLTLPNPAATGATITGLPSGTWYLSITSYTATAESDPIHYFSVVIP